MNRQLSATRFRSILNRPTGRARQNIRNYPQPRPSESATVTGSLGPADVQTGYRDPVHGVRRIEVKGRKKGQPIRLTTNEWYKAQQLGDSFWLYVVWSPLEKPDPIPVMIQNPAKHLEHAAKAVVSARFYDISAEAIYLAATRGTGGHS